jgi:hypothetical protein
MKLLSSILTFTLVAAIVKAAPLENVVEKRAAPGELRLPFFDIRPFR